MNTQVKENGQAKGADLKADKNPKFVAGNPVNVVSQKLEAGKTAEPAKAEEVKPVAEAQNAEPTKKELKAQVAAGRPALNLEQTLKRIKDLSRLSNQREKLITTIDELQGFEIKQEDEAEETSLNHFQRCELKITDDRGDSFSTKNPFIIDQVAKNISALCLEKLSEVEGQISLNL